MFGLHRLGIVEKATDFWVSRVNSSLSLSTGVVNRKSVLRLIAVGCDHGELDCCFQRVKWDEIESLQVKITKRSGKWETNKKNHALCY